MLAVYVGTWFNLKRVLVMAKKENYVVVNGIRYDAILDSSRGSCVSCDLNEICEDVLFVRLPLLRTMCGRYYHFIKHKGK